VATTGRPRLISSNAARPLFVPHLRLGRNKSAPDVETGHWFVAIEPCAKPIKPGFTTLLTTGCRKRRMSAKYTACRAANVVGVWLAL